MSFRRGRRAGGLREEGGEEGEVSPLTAGTWEESWEEGWREGSKGGEENGVGWRSPVLEEPSEEVEAEMDTERWARLMMDPTPGHEWTSL